MREFINEAILEYSEEPEKTKRLIDETPSEKLLLFATLGLDSLDLMNVVFTIEAKYKIKVNDMDIIKVKTLEEFYKLFENGSVKAW